MGLLQAREDGGTHTGLEVEHDHQGEGVGGESVVAGVVDLAVPGPLLDGQHQRSDSPVQLGVAVEEVGVPHTKYIRQLRLCRNILPSPVNVVDTEVHVNARVSGPSCPELEKLDIS